MRCTNNRMDPRIRRKSSRRRRRRRQQRMAAVLITLAVLIGAAAAGGLIIWGQFRNYTAVYEADHYNTNVYQGTLFSSDLCVTADEVTLEGFEPDKDLHAAGLFDLEEQKVLCGYKIFDKVYPASTTKIMTALLALKNGNMDDVVTVSSMLQILIGMNRHAVCARGTRLHCMILYVVFSFIRATTVEQLSRNI